MPVDRFHARAVTRAVCVLLLATIALIPSSARADDAAATPAATSPVVTRSGRPLRVGHPLNPRATRFYRPEWRRVNFVEYTGAGLSLAALIAEDLILQPRRPDLHWSQPILFDQDVRRALAVRNNESLTHTLNDVSWGLLGGLIAYPVVVDVPIAAARGGGDLAWQLFWQDALVLSSAAAIDLALRDLTGRARPYYYDCLTQGAGCSGSVEETRSFPGGHMAVSSAGAALICTQHLATKLYGGPLDVAICGTAVAADLAVGVMRIMLDVHWTSDILVGMALGSLIGWTTPQLMNYMRHTAHSTATSDGSGARPSAMVVPMLTPTQGGGTLGMVGMF